MVIKAKKREILKASALLFHEKGYKATTLQEVAKAVNMEAPSLYNHINSKTSILSDLLLTVANEFVHGIDLIIGGTLSSVKKLEKLIQLHVSLSFKYPDTMSLMLADYVHLPKEDKMRYLNLKSTYELKFKSIINDCIVSGDIMYKNTDLLVFALLSTLRSMYAWIKKHNNINQLELEEDILALLLDGIRKRN